jgi:hypothetical protein
MLKPSGRIRTLVGDSGGALLAELAGGERSVWILSDPDVMSNHGIVKGENAAFMVSVIKSLSEAGDKNRGGRRNVVFDETVHGFISSADSIFRLMMSFPHAVVTVLAFVSAALLAAAGARRFGAPAAPRPALDFGRARLIDNGARLLDYGGRHAEILERYARMTISDTARALRAPGGMDDASLAAWIGRAEASRSVSASGAPILSALSAARAERPERAAAGLMETARLAHKWKGEMVNGSSVRR